MVIISNELVMMSRKLMTYWKRMAAMGTPLLFLYDKKRRILWSSPITCATRGPMKTMALMLESSKSEIIRPIILPMLLPKMLWALISPTSICPSKSAMGVERRKT